jgi:hypothetical protein
MDKKFLPLPRFEGYYWNTETETLWSSKRGGMRELKLQPATRYNEFKEGYVISHEGQKGYISKERLSKLAERGMPTYTLKTNLFDKELFEI